MQFEPVNPYLLDLLLDAAEKHAFVPAASAAGADASPVPPSAGAAGGQPPAAPGGYPAGGGQAPTPGGAPAPGYPAGGDPGLSAPATISGGGGAPPGAGGPPLGPAPGGDPTGGGLEQILQQLNAKLDALAGGGGKPTKKADPGLVLSAYTAKIITTMAEAMGLGPPASEVLQLVTELTGASGGNGASGGPPAKPASGEKSADLLEGQTFAPAPGHSELSASALRSSLLAELLGGRA